MRFNRNRLRDFVEEALQANISYLQVRRDLYGRFSRAIDHDGDCDVENQHVITLRTFLTSREPRPPDQARLAYEIALLHIHELVEEVP